MATKKQIRKLVAQYLRSEGCGCCCAESHGDDQRALCKALNFPEYGDGSGHDYQAILDEEE